MDSVTKSISLILDRLRHTSASQRSALFLGGVLVAISLYWLANWAATPEMTPLLLQDLKPEEITRITATLDTGGHSYKVVGSRVLVASSANITALRAQLAQQGAMPESTATSFEAVIKDSSPWVSQSESDRRWNHAMKQELERILARFDGVQSANVMLPVSPSRRSFSRAPDVQTASVQLIMRNGQALTRDLALAAAKMVAGAIRGLSVRNVQVTDSSGANVLDSDDDVDSGGAYNRERQRQEKVIADKIRVQIADPRARVSVQVELDLTTRSSTTLTPIEGVETTVDTSETTTTRAKRSAQPGVEPNVGISVSGGGADENQKTTTEKKTLATGTSKKDESTHPGNIMQITAAINISHTYLLSILQRATPDKTSATAEELQSVFDAERKRLADLVVKLVKPQKPENVAIGWYYDATPPPVTMQSGALDQSFEMAKQYGPQAGLGLLALVSLTMMMRLSKKATTADGLGLELGLPKEAIEAARRQAEANVAGMMGGYDESPRSGGGGRSRGGSRRPTGDVEEVESVDIHAVGQAAVTEGVLVAQEVDETSVQSHKMVDQIVQMVDQDSESLSSLFEQWIRRDESGT